MVLPVNHVYVDMINAFRTNCVTLIEKFEKQKCKDFQNFLPIWKAMRFSLIYENFTNFGLLYDFKEDTLQVVKIIMLEQNFVPGLFLLYGLYCIQPYPKSSIRLEIHEFEKILKILNSETQNEMVQYHCGLFFAKLLKSNAFHFVRFSREFSMEGINRARMIFSDQKSFFDNNRRVKPKEWLQNIMEKIPFAEEMKDVEMEYLQRKKKLKEERPELNLTLDMVQHDIISSLLKGLKQTDRMADSTTIDIGTRRRRLKNRKMKIKQRYTTCSDSDSDSNDNKSPPGLNSGPLKRGRKRGCPKGERKYFFTKAINYPDSDSDSFIKKEPISQISVLSLPKIPK